MGGNPLVAQVEDSETVWTGTRLIEDGFDLQEAFESKSWVAGGLATLATAADTASAVIDPLGEALSAGVAWVIEHLGSLNEWLNELTGDSDAVAAAASTWSNIGSQLGSCADDLDAVCTTRLAGQESLAVATFKSLQAGSASHLRMTGGVASAISGGLTVASVIVRMVHDLVRDAIADVIGKVASKVAIGVLTAGLAAPWAVASVTADVSSWVTRLSKEVADVVLSARNLKGLLERARSLLGDVGEKFGDMVAMAMGRGSKKADDAAEAAEDAVDAAVDGTKGADGAVPPGKGEGKTSKYDKDIPELFRHHEAQKAAKQDARTRLEEVIPEGYSLSDFTRRKISDTITELMDAGHSEREIAKLSEIANEASNARKGLNDAAARIGEAGGEKHLTDNGYSIPDEFRADNVGVNNGTAPRGWVDGMALSPGGDEMVVAEYKGVGARVDSTPRPTVYEGKAPQASPKYVRDHMLSDPRFAQYFHDHPDVWQSVQNGDTKLTIKVIATREPGRIEVSDTPFELTPEVTQHLQESINSL